MIRTLSRHVLKLRRVQTALGARHLSFTRSCPQDTSTRKKSPKRARSSEKLESQGNPTEIELITLSEPSSLDLTNELVESISDALEELPSWDRGGRTKANALTPLYHSIRKFLDENKGCVCLVQVGSFYELYFEQAVLIGPKLGIKVATRQTSNHSVPMAGFPVSQLRKNVKILVHDLLLNVAIIDQYNSVKTDTDLKHRKVSRIVSPGTLVDELFMNFSQNNYLVAISFPPNSNLLPDPDMPIGLLWADISLGEFYLQQTTLADLANDLKRINPSEVIVSKDLQGLIQPIEKVTDLKRYFLRYHRVRYADQKQVLSRDTASIRKFVESLTVREEAAMNLILSYMTYNLPDRQLQLEVPTRFVSEKYLAMDSRTREALEISGRSTSGTVSVSGTLWLIIKSTVTPSGTRLLNKWINLPILDKSALIERQEYVELLKQDTLLRIKLTNTLKDVGDFSRALQKLALKSGSAVNHLLTIADSLSTLRLLYDQLDEARVSETNVDKARLIKKFLDQMIVPTDVEHMITETLVLSDIPKKLAKTINKDLDLSGQLISAIENKSNSAIMWCQISQTEDPGLDTQVQFFSVRKDYDRKLKVLHKELDRLESIESKIFSELLAIVHSIDDKGSVTKKEKVGKQYHVISIQCKLKYLSAVCDTLEKRGGFNILEKKKQMALIKPVIWTDILEKREVLLNQISNYEKVVIEKLRLQTLEKVADIRKASSVSDTLDVIASFAKVAHDNHWVRPEFTDRNVIDVKDGRHPVVESNLKDNSLMFVSNSTDLGTTENVWVILGPNMGGKSTFLRQNALIVILAQMGSFVPARYARLGLVDRLFTRIGASDDIFSDLSTFMVEMIETSNILKNATKRSLAIVDEIGRGTSGNEGLAIAYATLISLAMDNKCRTLFATHYGGELTKLLEKDGVDKNLFRFFKTKVLNEDGALKFDYKLSPGISNRSYAINIAKLAGFPDSSLKHATRAQDLLTT